MITPASPPSLFHSSTTAIMPSSQFTEEGDVGDGIATNVILNEEEQFKMRIALELIEEARDMEKYEYCSAPTIEHAGDDYGDVHDEEKEKLEFQIQQEEKQHTLYTEAISIMESLFGYYHPDVSNTYHLFGWSLYELGGGHCGKRTASALVYFLRALRINQRLFGTDHTSTCILLDDISDLVDEQRVEYNNEKFEYHCSKIFDSWVYQNLAEEALLVHKDPITAMRLYHEALRILPTDSSMADKSKGTTYNDDEMSNDDGDNDNSSSSSSIDHGDDDTDEEDDDNNICIAELERGIIQLNMAAILQKYQMHFVADNDNCAFDLYCKSLNVLPYWYSDIHPIVKQAE
jgi:tetratricopeptide (TPR) repeat protein